MYVHESMTRKVLKVEPETKLDTLIVEYSRDEFSRLAFVTDEEDVLLGIISSFDLLCRIAGGNGLTRMLGRRSAQGICEGINKHKHMTAADLMITKFVSVSPTENVTRAMDIISQKKYMALPVVKGTTLVGEISRRSIMRSISQANWCQLVS